MARLTQDEKDAIRDADVAQWWKDWYAADYSWEGLTKYPWQGWTVVENKVAYDAWIDTHGLPKGCPNRACQVIPKGENNLPKGTKTRPATLQDYWRDQEDHLQEQLGGKKYTVAHLPIKFKGGMNSWKAKPNDQRSHALSELIADRLNCSVETDVSFEHHGEKIDEQDGRACFIGCVLLSVPRQIQSRKYDADSDADPETLSNLAVAWHLSLEMAAIIEPQSFQGVMFGSAANFARTLFQSGNTNFTDAQFSSGGADFSDAQFTGTEANFIQAQFSGGNARFSGAKFSGGDATFVGTQFSGGEANFEDARFSKVSAYFRLAQFSGGHVDFGAAQFSGEVTDFGKAKFSGGDAYFNGAQFSGIEVNFRSAQFTGGDVYFGGVHFANANVSFESAQFSGGGADFGKVDFSGEIAIFRDAKFSGGDADFTNARFKRDINFRNSQIVKTISFTDAIFPPVGESHDAFRGTEFLGPALFNRTKFKDDEDLLFPTSDLHFPFNAFGLAKIKDQLILTQRGDKEAQIEFDHALKSLAEACQGQDRDFIETRYAALESGCRTLKQAMETVSDKNRAQRYFEFELRARQRRPFTPRLVKLFSTFYGWTADYGGSISRPLVTLGLLWLGFALIYGVNAHFADVDLPTTQKFWGAADFSATQIFRPLFIWSKAGMGDTGSWLYQYHAGLSAGGWLTIKFLATAQSFISLTLLFLFGLATKRKFQIS